MAAGERDEIETLRQRVRILAAALGLDEQFEVPPEVRRLAAAGHSVQAISVLRKHTRLSLVAAKRMVDALES